MTLAFGVRLGPYEIEKLIGVGGMGEVYRAIDRRLDRRVAVKVLPEDLSTDAESLARFEREARAIAALSHPNIVAVFDVGSEGEVRYVVTELLEGETLRARLRHGALGVGETMRVATGIADGLGAAHAKGIIHRDLKPENVFLTAGGGVKILDFGLAHRLPSGAGDNTFAQTEKLTIPGLVMGTIGYMSPEQLSGKRLTPASDVFAFGCVVFEMFAGDTPFRRDSDMEVIASVLRDAPFSREPHASMPAGLRSVVERCLEKDPAARFQSGSDLRAALREALASGSAPIAPMNPTIRTRRTPVSRRARTLVIAGAAIIVVLIAMAMFVRSRRELIDDGYDLRASDVTGNAETRRLTALAMRADAAGDRPEAIQLMQEAARHDDRAPLPRAFLTSFVFYSGDRADGMKWAAETRRRVAFASSTYESLLCRFLMPDNTDTGAMALASSLLELRPRAWRLRLALGHLRMSRREIPAALAQLKQIDVGAPDDRRLALVLSDRGSFGDLAGAERDLKRSRLMNRPALRAYAEARFAWTREHYADAARLFDETAENATVQNSGSVAVDAYVLAGAARIAANDLDGAATRLDVAALKAEQAGRTDLELEAHVFAAYVAYRRGNREEVERHIARADRLTNAGFPEDVALRLFAIRMRVPRPAAPPARGRDVDTAVLTLLDARTAWAAGDLSSASRLLQRARAEGVDATWFAEEAALLDHDLGAPARKFKPDPPYPIRLRLVAVFELSRAAR
ncbi:MAG: eukaryotic-like serine/threonine-protein kinase [Acidobacteriota bacterium]|jgi:tetratricopeptide (TPR) repeat protein|nr:eukaryotic-like serine/threonine-protein kinase [Acidobacteriota bacterium]